jgi:hypothetical protein
MFAPDVYPVGTINKYGGAIFMITPNACPVPELCGNPEPLPKLLGTDVNPLYELPDEPLAPQTNVALLIPKPPFPNGPALDDTKVNPLRSTVPDADITTFEPTSVIVTVIGAEPDVGVGVGVLVAGTSVAVGVGVLVNVGVGVGVSVGGTSVAVGVGVLVNVGVGVGVSVGGTSVAVGVGVGVLVNVGVGVGVD